MLSADVPRQFEQSGFAVLRDAFPRADILELGRRMEVELERLAAVGDSLPEDMRRNMARSEMPAHDSLAKFRLDPSSYQHLTQSQPLRESLGQLFGEPYVWHYPTMFRKITPGRKEGFLPFHQDYSYNLHYSHLITCWVPMSDCGNDAPSISVVAANVSERFAHVSEGKWESGVPESSLKGLLESAPIVDLECRAGDLVLFGELTLHRTCFRPSMNKPRLSMDARAVPLSAIPEEARRKRKFVAADRPQIVALPS